MTLRSSGRQARPRWLALLAIVGVLSVLGASAVLATLDRTKFELDKDATNNTTYTKIGVLNAAVASATGTTSISICQDVAVTTGYNGATILIDSERMTLAGGVAAGGGGCPAGFTFKVTYTATRAVLGTSPGAHAKAEDVSKIDTGSFGGPDWDQVYDLVTTDGNNTGPDDKCSDLGAVECAYTADGRAMSIFTSSKDYDEITSWQWRDQSVPDADELDDGFAIKYVANGDQNLYFGADRFATNGSKDAGFWFFHKDVGTVSPVGTADGTFTGTHTAPVDSGGDGFCNESAGGTTPGSATSQPSPVPACIYDTNDKGGDVLILTTFTGGGATTTVRVFEWVGPAGSTAALLERGVASDCVPGDSSQKLCATVNNTTVETKWTYSGKSEAASNNIPSGGLLEGGINLTDLHLEGCFSSFMATTRSAPSLTADPKDFILGSFEACGSSLTTTPKSGGGGALTADSDSDNLDEITIGTNGTVQVKDSAVLNVSGTTSFTGSLAFYICGPIANPTACNASGVNAGFSGNPVTTNGTYVSNAVTLSSTGRYCWFATFTSGTQGVPPASDGSIESAGPPKSTGECFEVVPVTPTLTTTAVEPLTLMSPTIYGEKADMNGSGTVTGDDDSNAFYGSTSIIDGQLDCNSWTSANDGAAGSGTITIADDCTLIGYDGTADGVTIVVQDGLFKTADGVAIANGTRLPTVFNATTPNSNDISDSDFAWSARFGRVDSNGSESIGGTDCSFDVIGTRDILGSDATCGFGTPIPAALNGYVDLNGDGKATSADSCSGCFLGRNVANGLIQTGPVDFGQPVYDVATLTGTANQPGSGGPAAYPTINPTVPGAAANGKITFTLTGPGTTTTACNTTAAGTGSSNPQDVTVSGDGPYPTLGVTPNAPGTYHWKAVYSGDPAATPGTNTLGTSHNAGCTDTGEDVVVRQIPSEIATGPYVYPQDSASIRSSITGDLLPAGGTVVFKLFGPTTGKTGLENCQANTSTGLVYSETKLNVVPSGGAHEVTGINTDNTSFSIDSSKNGLYYWLVTYTTGDQVHTSRQSACAESTSVTNVDAAYPGSLFTP